MPRRLSVRTKLLGATLIMTIGLVVVSVVGLRSLSSSDHRTTQLSRRALPAARLIGEIGRLEQQVRSVQGGRLVIPAAAASIPETIFAADQVQMARSSPTTAATRPTSRTARSSPTSAPRGRPT